MKVDLDHSDVLVMLKQACEEAGSQYQWATKHKLSPSYVSDVLAGCRDLGPSILKSLGLKKLVKYGYCEKGTR